MYHIGQWLYQYDTFFSLRRKSKEEKVPEGEKSLPGKKQGARSSPRKSSKNIGAIYLIGTLFAYVMITDLFDKEM